VAQEIEHPASKVQSSELKPQYHKKTKQTNKINKYLQAKRNQNQCLLTPRRTVLYSPAYCFL
jgi:hypothetical protein